MGMLPLTGARLPAGPGWLAFPPDILRASLGGAAVRVAGVAALFLVGLLLARHLGPAEYGLYGVAVSTAAILAAGGTLGIPGLVAREASRAAALGDRAKTWALLRWSLRRTAALFAAVLALALLLALGLGAERPTALNAAVALLAVLGGAISLVAAFLRGLGALVLGQALDLVLRPGVFLAVLVLGILVVPGLQSSGAVALHAAAALGVLAYAGLRLLREMPARDAPVRLDPGQSARWFRSAVPMGGTELLRALDANVPLILSAALASLDAVGQFRVAAGIASLLLIPYSMFNTMAVPLAARLTAQGRESEIQQFVLFAAVASSASALALTVAFASFGDALIVSAFGSEYEPAWRILIILCLAQVVHSAFCVNPALLNALGREIALFTIFGVSLLLAVSMAVPLTILFGVEGTALAILIAALVRAVALNIYTEREFGIRCFVLSRPGARR